MFRVGFWPNPSLTMSQFQKNKVSGWHIFQVWTLYRLCYARYISKEFVTLPCSWIIMIHTRVDLMSLPLINFSYVPIKHCHLFHTIRNKWDVSLEQKKLVYALLRIYVVNSTTNNMFFMYYMYKWSNFKDKYVVFRVFKIQTWDWEQVTPFRDSTIGVRKLYFYLLYRWLSFKYLLTYLLPGIL